jgi:hypothetical protein
MSCRQGWLGPPPLCRSVAACGPWQLLIAECYGWTFRPSTHPLDVDDRAVVDVLPAVEVAHTDLSEVTGVVPGGREGGGSGGRRQREGNGQKKGTGDTQ